MAPLGWATKVPDVTRMRGLRALLLDLDGVVYRGNRALPGAVEFFAFLQERGIRFSLITNNSTQTGAQFAEKLHRLGIAVSAADVLTSAEATADYLSATAAPRSRVLVVGGYGLRAALRRVGFGVASHHPDYVVVGLDMKLTYAKLCRASVAIRAGARFIASNADATLPTEEGEIPGSGAIVAALQAASGVAPTVIGKPQPLMLEMAMGRLGVSPKETAIVGDRLGTDVLAGHRLDICTILVLTGVTTREELAEASLRPDFVFAGLRQLQEALATAQRNTPYHANELRSR